MKYFLYEKGEYKGEVDLTGVKIKDYKEIAARQKGEGWTSKDIKVVKAGFV